MIKQVCKNITICSLALSTALTVFPASSYAKINSEIKQVSEKNLDGETKMYTRTATTSDSQKILLKVYNLIFLLNQITIKRQYLLKRKVQLEVV